MVRVVNVRESVPNGFRFVRHREHVGQMDEPPCYVALVIIIIEPGKSSGGARATTFPTIPESSMVPYEAQAASQLTSLEHLPIPKTATTPVRCQSYGFPVFLGAYP